VDTTEHDVVVSRPLGDGKFKVVARVAETGTRSKWAK
jgi:hypothetical protein